MRLLSCAVNQREGTVNVVPRRATLQTRGSFLRHKSQGKPSSVPRLERAARSPPVGPSARALTGPRPWRCQGAPRVVDSPALRLDGPWPARCCSCRRTRRSAPAPCRLEAPRGQQEPAARSALCCRKQRFPGRPQPSKVRRSGGSWGALQTPDVRSMAFTGSPGPTLAGIRFIHG